MRWRVSLPSMLLPLLVLGCPSEDAPADGSETETGDGDGDGDPSGDGDGDPSGDGDGDPSTGDGDGDPTTGDGDGDPSGDSYVLVRRESLADGHQELIAIDLSDPTTLGPSQTILSLEAPGAIQFGESTPWGAKTVLYGTTDPWDRNSEQLVYAAGEGFELAPLLPEGFGPVLASASWASDASWAVARIQAGPDSVAGAVVEYDANGSPTGAVTLTPEPGNLARVNDAGQLLTLDAGIGDDVYELRLRPVHPSVGPSVLVTELVLPPPLMVNLHLDETRLVYSNDLGQDGANEQFVVDLADVQAPPVLVTTQIEGTQRIRSRWSPSNERMIYWTGEGVYGRLYLVEFDGAVPQAPVLLSGADQVLIKDFEFFGEDRVVYVRGDGDDQQGLMLVELDGGPSPAVQISETPPPGDVLYYYVYDVPGNQLAYELANPDASRLAVVDLDQAQPTPVEVFSAADGDYIVPTLPKVGTRMALTAPLAGGGRGIYSVDLADLGQPPIRLDETLPVGWDHPLSVSVTADETQVVFRSGPEGGPDTVPVRVPIDGSGPVEPLFELGWDSNFTVVSPQ